jgi:hypothetical protein
MQGKWIWIWNLVSCDAGQLEQIIAHLKAAGCAGALVKAWDGGHTFPQRGPAGVVSWHTIADAFHAAGLKIASWGYCYGANPTDEATVASIASCDAADAIVLDVEVEYKRKDAQARTLCARLRQDLPELPLLYSSFAIARYHQDFPFEVFNELCQAAVPQVYWNAFARWPMAEALQMTYDDHQAMGLSPERVLPAAGVYTEGTVQYPAPGDVQTFIQAVKAAGSPGCSFWSYEHMDQAMWDAVKAAEWPVPGMPWTGWEGETDMSAEDADWIRGKLQMASKLMRLAAAYRDSPTQDLSPERECWEKEICPEVHWRAEQNPAMRPTKDQCRRWADDPQTPD